MENLSCFKAYDVRGLVGSEINKDLSYKIGCSVVEHLGTKNVVIGFDARSSSPEIAEALSNGIKDAGADVLNIGLSGTEEMYWAVSYFKACAGITVTASHNPKEYNGMKFAKSGSRPFKSSDLAAIKSLVQRDNFLSAKNKGKFFDRTRESKFSYANKILSFVELKQLKPIKIVLDSGNGAAGPALDILISEIKKSGLSANFVLYNHEPDSSFPNGVPNPLIKENQLAISKLVQEVGADLGVAFDGDFDRCFLFDEKGNFVPVEILIGLIASIFLKKEPGAAIVHDQRVIWNIADTIDSCDGQSVISNAGHNFVKTSMRQHSAIYGGELSSHHYFRDFVYCDSGMLPWLLIWQFISSSNKKLSSFVSERQQRFISSGEINFKVKDPKTCLENIKTNYRKNASSINECDGLSVSFLDWRFNLRISNTEPLLRLNIETIAGGYPVVDRIQELKNLIVGFDS